jgi:hypothetical protein
MKNLLTLCLMVLTFVSYSQSPKYITIKRWKNGVLVSTKSIPIVRKYEVTKVKYVPVKSKPKVVEVKVPVPFNVEKIVFDSRKVDSLNMVITNLNIEFSKISSHKGSYVLNNNQGVVVVEEKVSNNQIIGRTFSADIKPQYKDKIVEVARPKVTEWFMGPTVTTNLITPFQSFGLAVQRKGKSDNILQMSFGGTIRDGYMEPRAIFGAGYLLKLK